MESMTVTTRSFIAPAGLWTAALLAVALAAIVLPAAASAQSCWSLSSVLESAQFDRNAGFGGHVPLHFRTSTPPFFRHPDDTQEDKSLFDTRDEYAAAISAAKEAPDPPECPPGGGRKVTQKVPLTGPAFHCAIALNDGSCAAASRFSLRSVRFVFSYVDGRWIVLTAFPQRY